MMYFAATALAPLMTYGETTLENGVRLHYARQGPTSGPAIVFLHGYSDSSFSFSRVMPLLPPELRAIAPDLRGHGDSDRPSVGYRMTDMANDVVQLMNALEIPSAILVGHSMGSFVAQAVAERAPERLTALMLVGSGPRPGNAGMIELGNQVAQLTDPVDEAFVRDFQYSCVARPVPDTFMAAAIDNSRRMPSRVWKQVIAGLIEFEPLLPRPPIRTLVLGGRKDAVFSVDEQTQVALQFVDARLQLFDDVGHTPHWETPQAFVAALLQFAR